MSISEISESRQFFFVFFRVAQSTRAKRTDLCMFAITFRAIVQFCLAIFLLRRAELTTQMCTTQLSCAAG